MTSPDERFDDAYATEIQVARFLNLECAHCGLKRMYCMNTPHICSVAIVDWIRNIAQHAPALALLVAEDLTHLQRTGEHRWP